MNYEELGFKCGIEIHQQLDTDTKLFCNCPIDLKDEPADNQVERFLKSVEGESGEKDKAAEVEAMKNQKFVYNYYKRNNCLVELDEEPPHEINDEALRVGLKFARMIEAEIPKEIQVMRKMVIDGSNTSGFQRTCMIGLEGEIETEEGTVSIEDIELEEESAGIHERTQDTAIYDLNRLGIPLIEVGTDASIKNPKHAKETAEKIGMLLRSTNKARRGLGTIRQDVNVSIENGSRVEIKGFQDVRNIDKLIRNEVERQKRLLEIGEDLDSHEIEYDDVTDIFSDTDNEIVSAVLDENGGVFCLKLPNLSGKMKENISKERYLAKELVDYARNQGPKGIIHTDEDIEKYGLEKEFEELSDLFEKKPEDVLAIIAAERSNAKKAIKEVKRRAEMLYKGEIPEETRSAEQDFTTSFSRPLPGSARMYPETDIPPVGITSEKVDEIDDNLPLTLKERQEKFKDNIGEELASQIVNSRYLGLFESLKDSFNAKIVANTLTNLYSELKSENIKVEKITEEDLEAIFTALEEDSIGKGDLTEVLSKSIDQDVDSVIQDIKDSKDSEEEIRAEINKILDKKEEMINSRGMDSQGALMGLVMQEVEADGNKVSEILQDELEKRV